MGKRNLTKQQQARIQQQQNRRRKQAQAPVTDKAATTEGDVPKQAGTVIANFGATLIVENERKQAFRCTLRQNIPPLVSGDHIVWQQVDDETGVVVALHERSSFLARPDRRGHAKVIAANIDQIMIVSACKPALNTRLIDRYLVAAETAHITPSIIFNKIDLLDRADLQEIEQQLQAYQDLGYTVLYTSTKQDHGMDALQSCLLDKTSVFVGQSGVGKSSLINALLPEAMAHVAEVSQSTQKGRHTTTMARLYHLPSGGQIIDSPGIREFGLWQVSQQQLAEGFREFRPFLGQCRFRDCLHEDEPGCLIRENTATGKITEQRWQSYRRILESLREMK